MLVISEVIREMEELTNDIGLKINVGKTKYMTTSKCKHKNMQFATQNINYEEYQEVLDFKYLASLVTYYNDCGKGVQARITAGNRSYQAVSKIIKSRYISKHTKLKICATVIKHTVLYRCETWAVAEQMKSAIKTWKWKIRTKKDIWANKR
jgi:ribosomal protein S18